MSPEQEVSPAASLIAETKEDIDRALAGLVGEAEPPELYEPVRYVLSGGGKRLRPMLVVLTARAFGADRSSVIPPALAVEVFHNFTLVHDDIMDRAPERRGRPTVHKEWDEGTAILVGDYLLSLSYSLLAEARTPRINELLTVYHDMVRRLCEGQMLDAAFERRTQVSTDEYLDMIDRKTSALLAACFQIGGLLGDADDSTVEALYGAGLDVGRAFQIRDDLLDLTADDSRWGKKRGGDLLQAKKTYLLARAMESGDSSTRAWFADGVARGGLDESQIDEAEDRLHSMGVLDEALRSIHEYSQAALEKLSGLPENEPAGALVELVGRLRDRLH
ncbi:MAG: polyprenyl synthetase family protein [Rhodothermales bacterium]|nr:polyprenyl synthetase family protein [Rhodothermales bacterium]